MSKHFSALGQPIWGVATEEEHIAHEQARIAQACRYFNGLRHKTCEAGIPYWPQGPQPCFLDDPSPHTCPSRVFLEGDALTQAARERYGEIRDAIALMTARGYKQECLVCGAPVASRRKVGRCLYADPCGHRQGQG